MWLLLGFKNSLAFKTESLKKSREMYDYWGLLVIEVVKEEESGYSYFE
jgi:hypothetical protein